MGKDLLEEKQIYLIEFQDLISPYDIQTMSSKQVMRITNFIN